MKIKLAKSSILDSKFLFDLRNSPEIRKSSINQKKISFKDHKKWFFKFIKNKKNKIFIIKFNLKNIGYIRASKSKKNFLISIAIKKEYTRIGIGKISLLNFEKIIKVKKLTAHVLRNNTNSLNFFFSCNYCIDSVNKNFFIMKKNVVKNKFTKVINEIENIRKKNNTNWMDILRVAFKYSPNETAKIMAEIYKEDRKISLLSKKLKNLT
jgi:ribosomal protein S18 acetylase RimI-like enzyme